MLQDLEESGQLMDRFCDNDLLERLDQVMVQANMQTEVRQGVWLVGGARGCDLLYHVYCVYSSQSKPWSYLARPPFTDNVV